MLARIHDNPFFRKAAELRRSMEEWSAANPELSAAWDEAREDDAAHDEARRRTWEADQAKKRRLDRLSGSGLPLRCLEASQAGLTATATMLAVEAFAKSEHNFLLLSGGRGAGKTIGAASLLIRAMDNGASALFYRAAELSRTGLYGEAAQERISNLESTGLLVLDDLGAEILTDPWRCMLDELVDARYAEKLCTVITTNLSPVAFRERYGERIADRIRHDGTIVQCGTESLRKPEVRT